MIKGLLKIAYLGKPPYKQLEMEALNPSKKDEAWTAKIDGAHTIIDFKEGEKPRLFSHRISKKTHKPIEYTTKLPHIKHKSPVTAVVRGETFAVDSKGRAVHPDIVTAMLVRNPDKSKELLKEHHLKTKTALIDIDRIDHTDVRNKPFEFKRRYLEEIAASDPDFVLPDIAYTQRQKSALLKKIESGKHPQTKEGLVLHNIHGEKKPFIKAKITADHDVYVRKIFQEESPTGRAPMAGGFEYSWDPHGPIVGKVGTGFDHALKADMLKNPQDYIGRAARVQAHDVSKNNVLVKPSFIGWHVEKNLDKPSMAKQTVIINKSIVKNLKEAKKIARGFGEHLEEDETGQSYRFRQIDPKEFVPGTFRTFKPKEGVSIVYGQLKKEAGLAGGLNHSLKKKA